MSEESVNEENVGPRLSNHWPSVLFQIYLHMSALYGLILVFTQASLMTTLFCKYYLSMALDGQKC